MHPGGLRRGRCAARRMRHAQRRSRTRQGRADRAGSDEQAPRAGCDLTVAASQRFSAIGLIEVQSFAAALAALDAMEKAGDIELLQAEINDLGGMLFKVAGETADVDAALAAGRAIAEQMQAKVVSDAIRAPQQGTIEALLAKKEFNPLIEQDV